MTKERIRMRKKTKRVSFKTINEYVKELKRAEKARRSQFNQSLINLLLEFGYSADSAYELVKEVE